MPLSLPNPTGSLRTEAALSAHLLAVTAFISERTDTAEIAVYLVDPATDRLRLRAWSADDHAGVSANWDTPSDLTDHGIDGDKLAMKTLRRFVRAAPQGKRLAHPLTSDGAWFGAVVGIAADRFSDTDAAVLKSATIELGTQLKHSGVRARLLEADEGSGPESESSEPIFGHGVSSGTAYAAAVIYDLEPSRAPAARSVAESPEQALSRLDRAISETRAQLETLTADTGSDLYDVVSLLFSTHVMMLTDEAFSGAMRSLVEAGQTPEDAVQSVVDSFVKTFGSLREARLAETAHDVRDIGLRLGQNLADRDTAGQDFTDKIVLLEDALPSDLVRLAMGNAGGVVILGASATAHISILARSLGLPALITDDRSALEIADETMILLDADGGRLYVAPSPEQLESHGYDASAGPQRQIRTATAVRAGEGSDASHRTADGVLVSILANVNLLGDARRGLAMGANGIGLYRSEFPFIIRNDFISEDEQFRVYRAVVQSMPGKPITLRTADIGGDKLMAGREEERNPFLGVRGIRFSLANRNLFRDQLRAMLRAGAGSDLRLMFPMVSTRDELDEAKEEVYRCIDSLRADGLEHNPAPKLGAMIELPSAVIQVEDLAEQSDFLSIGTNDLIMYLLAVDRTNERLSELYRSHHPVVLRTLADIARRVGGGLTELSVCGESAADPQMIPFYLGIGIRKLSVAPRKLPGVASVVARYDIDQATTIANEMLSLRTLKEMDLYLSREPLLEAK